MRTDISPDPEALAHRVAAWLGDLAAAKAGRFSVALSGGSTPKRLYELLAAAPFRDTFPWSRTVWFFGDERVVPRTDKRSNYRMVHEAMLAQAPIPPDNIHLIDMEGGDADAAARAYEATLQEFYGENTLDPARPLFDVVLLGLGPDGHTASLFPGSPMLNERTHWVAGVPMAIKKPDPQVARVTLTLPALNSAAHAAFLLAGAEKRPMFERLKAADPALPAAHVKPAGELYYFVDAAAAGTAS